MSVLGVKEFMKKKESIQKSSKKETRPGSRLLFSGLGKMSMAYCFQKRLTKPAHLDPADYYQIFVKRRYGFFLLMVSST